MSGVPSIATTGTLDCCIVDTPFAPLLAVIVASTLPDRLRPEGRGIQRFCRRGPGWRNTLTCL